MSRTCLLMTGVMLVVAGVASAQPSLGKPFDLKVGESVVFEPGGLAVGFDRIIGDSRCPIDMFCFWPGDAAGLLWTHLPSEEKTAFDLHTYRDFRWKFKYDRYEITLVAVAPYPRADVPIPPGEYVVTVVVDVAAPVEPSTWGRIKALYTEP